MERMNKGVLFTTDAILALGLIVTLFAGIVLISSSEPHKGAERMQSYTSSADKALSSFYNGGDETNYSSANNTVCKAIYEYDNGLNDKKVKVVECTP